MKKSSVFPVSKIRTFIFMVLVKKNLLQNKEIKDLEKQVHRKRLQHQEYLLKNLQAPVELARVSVCSGQYIFYVSDKRKRPYTFYATVSDLLCKNFNIPNFEALLKASTSIFGWKIGSIIIT